MKAERCSLIDPRETQWRRYMVCDAVQLRRCRRCQQRPTTGVHSQDSNGYVAEEALTFSSHYFRNVTTKFNRPDRNVDPIPPTCQFQIRQRHVDNDKDPEVSTTSELFALACGPTWTPISINSCVVDGVRYVVHSRDESRITQNNGICSPALTEKCIMVSFKKSSSLKDDPDIIHFDNSSDLLLSTSLNDLDNATLHIDGQSTKVDVPPDIIIDVVDEEDDITDDEDALPHDLAESDNEDFINVNDDGVDKMSADVARSHGGDGGGADRLPSHHVPLYYPSWLKVPKERKAALITDIGVFRSVCKSIGLRSVIRFDAQELKKVKWYVFHNSPEIDTYRSQYKRLQNYLPDKISKPIIELCSLFKQICSAILMEDDMLKAQIKVVDVLCDHELIYPPALFDIMIHLFIHLPLEALEGGPIFPSWMYPFKRYMKKLKGYVQNKAKPEGSIAEGYVAEEALTFSSHNFWDVTTKFNRPDHNVDPPLLTSTFPRRQVAGESDPQRQVAGESPKLSLGKAVNVVVFMYVLTCPTLSCGFGGGQRVDPESFSFDWFEFSINPIQELEQFLFRSYLGIGLNIIFALHWIWVYPVDFTPYTLEFDPKLLEGLTILTDFIGFDVEVKGLKFILTAAVCNHQGIPQCFRSGVLGQVAGDTGLDVLDEP
uniref:DUF4218 domain-containing protein n=1 Tax=Tanacetum cinerariifolium TaxID=118510 RepID=A0A6L2LQB9_TANCI|nr:hypothetical protein [Tanacetum cinerariifolium]